MGAVISMIILNTDQTQNDEKRPSKCDAKPHAKFRRFHLQAERTPLKPEKVSTNMTNTIAKDIVCQNKQC